MILDYFKTRKPLLIAIIFVICLEVSDWITTSIALNVATGNFYESNPIAAGWMSSGDHYWILNSIGVMLFLIGCITYYWHYLETKDKNVIQYYLFTVSLGVSPLTVIVINNIRLIVMWAIVR